MKSIIESGSDNLNDFSLQFNLILKPDASLILLAVLFEFSFLAS